VLLNAALCLLKSRFLQRGVFVTRYDGVLVGIEGDGSHYRRVCLSHCWGPYTFLIAPRIIIAHISVTLGHIVWW
jgi:hypothetical protein